MELKDILEQIRNNEIDLETAEAHIYSMGYTPVSEIAKIDTCRKHRTGIMEAILAEGKKTHDVVGIANVQIAASGRALITRIGKDHKDALEVSFAPEQIEWSLDGTTAVVHNNTPVIKTGGFVAIISAGTADVPVAEEARMVASEMGCDTLAIYDVGVAGLHRLVGEMRKIHEKKPDSIVVAAGREGTLPTIVSGLVDVPVIGLPVSTGYGTGGRGKAALCSMLQSCSVISVVNIDAGFVAGAFAARIANTVAEARKQNGDA